MKRPTILIVIILFIIIAAAGVFAFSKIQQTKPQWKTFTNQQYGYSIQYPDNWHLRQKDIVVFIENTKKPLYWSSGVAPQNPGDWDHNGYSISIIVTENKDNLTLEDYIYSVLMTDFEPIKTLIHGYNFIEAHEQDAFIVFSPHYFLDYNNYFYEIRCRDEADQNSNTQNIVDQILNSFQIF